MNRKAFEAWALTHDMDITPTPIACYSGIYSDCNTDYAWMAWQAAIAHETAKPVSKPERKPMTDEQIDAAIEAWFASDIVAGPRPFSKRMQAALDAATKEKS